MVVLIKSRPRTMVPLAVLLTGGGIYLLSPISGEKFSLLSATLLPPMLGTVGRCSCLEATVAPGAWTTSGSLISVRRFLRSNIQVVGGRGGAIVDEISVRGGTSIAEDGGLD